MKPGFTIHSYPWYMADWKNSETRVALTMAERGLYRELLDHCYTEGSIPEDERKLAGIAGCTITELRKLWPQVKQCFTSSGEEGRLHHTRVNEVLAKLGNWNEARRSGGHKRQVLRAAKARESGAKAELKLSYTSCTSSSTPTTTSTTTDLEPLTPPSVAEKKPPTELDLRVKAIAQRIVGRHERSRSCSVEAVEVRLRSIAKLIPAVGRLTELEAIDQRHERWVNSWDWTKEGGQFVKGLKSWLSPKDGLWRLEPSMSQGLVPIRAPTQQTFAERNVEMRRLKFAERVLEDVHGSN